MTKLNIWLNKRGLHLPKGFCNLVNLYFAPIQIMVRIWIMAKAAYESLGFSQKYKKKKNLHNGYTGQWHMRFNSYGTIRGL